MVTAAKRLPLPPALLSHMNTLEPFPWVVKRHPTTEYPEYSALRLRSGSSKPVPRVYIRFASSAPMTLVGAQDGQYPRGARIGPQPRTSTRIHRRILVSHDTEACSSVMEKKTILHTRRPPQLCVSDRCHHHQHTLAFMWPSRMLSCPSIDGTKPGCYLRSAGLNAQTAPRRK